MRRNNENICQFTALEGIGEKNVQKNRGAEINSADGPPIPVAFNPDAIQRNNGGGLLGQLLSRQSPCHLDRFNLGADRFGELHN